MSKGYGAQGRLLAVGDKQIEYAYCSYNVNSSDYEETIDELNGKLVLDISIFKTIDNYRRYKGASTDRERNQLKVKPDELNYTTLLEKGMVHIINSSKAWILDDTGTDKLAIRLVSKIIEEYKRTEKIPETIGLFY